MKNIGRSRAAGAASVVIWALFTATGNGVPAEQNRAEHGHPQAVKGCSDLDCAQYCGTSSTTRLVTKCPRNPTILITRDRRGPLP